MWGNKKPETPQAAQVPQAAQPEQKISQSNQAPKPAPATWEGKTAMSTDALRPLGAIADVIAREVVVYGNVKGNIRAKDRIEIKKDGSVIGDLTTSRIMIEDGAYFKGSIEIDRAADKEPSRSAFAKPAAAPAGTTAAKPI